MSTIDEAQSDAAQLESRLQFEALISELSSRFINVPPGETDREIDDALRRVCEFLGIDLAVLWQWSAGDSGCIVPTHSWCFREDWRPAQPMREEQYPWARQQMLAGRLFVASSLDDYPAEAAVDRETCRQFGVKSGVCLPLMAGGEAPIGALGLNDLRAERTWPDALVNRLQLIAQIFTHALARARADQALRENEELNRATFDQAAVGISHVGIDGRWLRVNDQLCAIFGYPREELLQLSFHDISHPDDRETDQNYVREIMSGKIKTYSVTKRCLRKDRTLVWVKLTVSLVRTATGEPKHFISVAEDITEHRRAEDELRDLSRRLISAHEDERALLARELHDDVTQRLAVLAIQVGTAELAAPDGAQAGMMQAVRGELIRLSEDVHSLAYHLHPSIIEEVGLAAALRAECERQTNRSQLELSVEIGPLPAVAGKEAELCLFRVAQEALNNVARHAGARAASVTLRQVDGGLYLAVRDDGVGFQPTRPGESMHLGLASMRERVQLARGMFDIESAPGRGTAIIAWVPMAATA